MNIPFALFYFIKIKPQIYEINFNLFKPTFKSKHYFKKVHPMCLKNIITINDSIYN